MAQDGVGVPLEALNRTSVLGGVLSLAYLSRRYKGAPTAIAKCLGDRLAEVLPADEYTVNVEGPVLSVSNGRGSGSTGMPGMLLLERGTPEEKLTRVFMEEAKSLCNLIAGAHPQSPASNAMRRATYPAVLFNPHVVVTDTAIEVWWGGADPEKALVRLRSIPRSEIGL